MRSKVHPLLASSAILVLVVLYAPMLAVAFFSVNASRYGLVWKGFTLQWYVRLLENDYILRAGWNSLVLAVISTVIATVLGTMMAMGIARFPWPKWTRGFLDFMVYLAVVSPDIIFAVTVIVAFRMLRTVWTVFEPGLLNMILAHVTFQIAFVALVVRSRLAIMGPTLVEAARDLGASSWYVFRRVTLPLLAPGIFAGAMLAFTLSLDDFVISFFTAGPRSTTLPIFIYASVRRGLTPEIHALSTLIFLVTVMLVIGLESLTRYRKD